MFEAVFEDCLTEIFAVLEGNIFRTASSDLLRRGAPGQRLHFDPLVLVAVGVPFFLFLAPAEIRN